MFTVLLLLKSVPNRERNMKTVQTFQELLDRKSFNRRRLYGMIFRRESQNRASRLFVYRRIKESLA